MSEQATFDAIVAEFYPVWLRYHPEIALAVGRADFVDRLPAAADDEVGALGVWLENLVLALGELDGTCLDADRCLDLQLLQAMVRAEYRERLVRDWRHLDPTQFLPLQEIFYLTLYPPRELHNTLLRLLWAVPPYLRQARGQLRDCSVQMAPQLVTVAMDEAEAGVNYLQALAGSGWLRHHCSEDLGQVQLACGQAGAAIQGYLDTLRQKVAPQAHGALGCGAEHFRILLELRHFLAPSLEGLDAVLETLYQAALMRLCEAAGRQDIPGEPAQVLAYLRGLDTHTGEHRLQTYREESNRLREWIRQSGLFTLPDVPLHILERPVHARLGHCDSGYLMRAEPAAGIFFISGQPASDVPDGEARGAIRSRCVRHGWAGAHLLAFAAAPGTRGLPRRFGSCTAFAGAWDLYLRELLAAAHWGNAQDHLWYGLEQLRGLRLAQVDLGLHLGQMDEDTALAVLGELEPTDAQRLLMEVTRRPTDHLGAVLGWRMLHHLRELLVDSGLLGLGELNDQLLGNGCVPPALLIPHLFGAETGRQVEKRLLF